jgi:hypothetical protein
MPIVFVHGVAVRDHSAFEGLETLLKRYIAPKLVPPGVSPDTVQVHEAYWAADAATFAYNRKSMPVKDAARNAAMGFDADALGGVQRLIGVPLPAETQTPSPTAFAPPGAVTAGFGSEPTNGAGANLPSERPAVTAEQLATFLVNVLASTNQDSSVNLTPATAVLAIAIDTAANEAIPAGGTALLTDELVNRVTHRAQELSHPGIVGQGFFDGSLGSVTQKAKALLVGAETTVGGAVASYALRYRQSLNTLLTNFFGDIFTYYARRDRTDGAPYGAIIHDVLTVLRQAYDERTSADEPLVVLSHSMGGQIVYEIITYYLELDGYRDISIDFWAAAASQVGLFEELKIFKVSDARFSEQNKTLVPFPPKHLGAWWNVWDPSDILSYTVAGIFEGVDDESFESGISPLQAHGGYLIAPAFYRRFGDKLAAFLTAKAARRAAVAGAHP